jgi:hypothetical protein
MLIFKEGSAPSIEESFRSRDPDIIMRYQSAESYPHSYTNVLFVYGNLVAIFVSHISEMHIQCCGSGSISQRHGSADPDLDSHQNFIDPQHCASVHCAYQCLPVLYIKH